MPLADVPGRVTRWTDFEFAGGQPLGALRQVEALTVDDAVDGPSQYSVSVDAALDGAALVPGEVHRVALVTGEVREYRIVARDEEEVAGEVARYTARGESPLLVWADAGLILETEGAVPRTDLGQELRTAEWLTFLCDRLAGLGFPYWEPGTVDDNAWTPLVAPLEGWTALQVLQALAAERQLEIVVRRGASKYVVDLVREQGATAPRVVVRWGRNLRRRAIQTDVGEQATAITVLGRVPEGAEAPVTMAEHVWAVVGVVGTTPAWVQLADVQGQEGPLAFDGQLVDRGVHLMRDDGTVVPLLGSRTSDQAVQVADGTNIAVGERVQFVADVDGRRLIELTRPNARRIARTILVTTDRGARNLARNGTWTGWVDVGTPAGGWTKIGGCQVARFNRPELYNAQAFSSMANHSIGATSLTLNTPAPFSRVYGGEVLRTTSGSPFVEVRVSGTVHEANADGDLTLPISPALSAALALSRVLQLWNITDSNPAGPIRPVWEALPDEPQVLFTGGAALRFLSDSSSTAWPPPVGQDQLRGPGVAVKVFGGTQRVNAAAGFTLTNRYETAPWGNATSGSNFFLNTTGDPALIGSTGRCHPMVYLVDVTGTPSLLAYGVCAGVLPQGKTTLHETVEISATLSADRTVAVALVPGRSLTQFAMCRWVSMWLGLESAFGPYDGARGTLLWQRANRELLARAHDGRDVEVTFFDLTRAAGYSITAEHLTLGGRLDLGDGQGWPRVVRLVLDLVEPQNSRAVLDGRSTRMTRLLAERL